MKENVSEALAEVIETTPTEPRLQLVPRVPTRLTEGRDELNFAEFPLSALSERPDPSVKTIQFEDKIFDRSKNEHIVRKVTITGSDAYGLPTPVDEEVLLALLQLSKLQDFSSKRVYFTRYQLLQLLKWPATGQSYARLDQSLKRWIGVTMYYKNAWRDKSEQCWVNESFHMLEHVKIVDVNEKRSSGQGNFDFAASYFEWNEVVFRSFKNGNVKALNYDFFLSIESSIAKRLYRFLDKRFYFSSEAEFDLKTLAFEHIGLSRKSPTGDLKRKLNSAIDELEEKNYLEITPKERRFVKEGPGSWRVIFRKKKEALSSIDVSATNSTERTLEEKLIDFGIREKKAVELIGQFSKEVIEEKIAFAKWMVEKKDSRISANPAGYLISAIEQDYQSPKEFKDIEVASKKKEEKARLATVKNEKALKKALAAAERDRVRKEAIEDFFKKVGEEGRAKIEKEALETADPAKQKFLHAGGMTAEVTRKLIVENYVLEILANG